MRGFAAGRALLLVLGFACLVLGIAGGLARLGVGLPVEPAPLAAHHGALMVGGFFGTLISLERAVALGRRWAYLVPLCAAGGGLALAGSSAAGPWLITAASGGLVVASLCIAASQRALFTAILALGSACWMTGSLLWLASGSLHGALPWWLGFFLLTIAGERLELTRVLPRRPAAERAFIAVVVVLVVAMAWASWRPDRGWLAFGLACGALAAWLSCFDIARRRVRASGLTHYIAVNLLAGYAWLMLSALAALGLGGLPLAGPVYDAFVHAIALGFVFSMVFGHAPVIFPAVLRVRLVYTPWFYAAPCVLHASIALRVLGDLGGWPGLRLAGAWGNVAALVLFVAVSVVAALRGTGFAGRAATPSA